MPLIPAGSPTFVDNVNYGPVPKNETPEDIGREGGSGEGNDPYGHYTYITTTNNGQNNNYGAGDKVIITFRDDGTTQKRYYDTDNHLEAYENWNDGNGETGHHRVGYMA
jgi:hypothetical protein